MIEILELSGPEDCPREIRTVLFDHENNTPYINCRITEQADFERLIEESEKLDQPPMLKLDDETYVSPLWLARLFPKHAIWYTNLANMVHSMALQHEGTQQ